MSERDCRHGDENTTPEPQPPVGVDALDGIRELLASIPDFRLAVCSDHDQVGQVHRGIAHTWARVDGHDAAAVLGMQDIAGVEITVQEGIALACPAHRDGVSPTPRAVVDRCERKCAATAIPLLEHTLDALASKRHFGHRTRLGGEKIGKKARDIGIGPGASCEPTSRGKPLELHRPARDSTEPPEENNSITIACNESFSGWTKTFTDPRLRAAIVAG